MLTLPDLSPERLFSGKRVLHFAAEPCLTSWIKPRAREYFTADLFDPRADLKIDLTDMRGIASENFDAFIVFDVLEHVTSDRAALAEIQRILKPGGVAILSVPQRDGLEVTVEDERVNTPELRELTYGQSDHVRLYGRDFEERVKDAGFKVTVVDHDSFPAEAVKYHVLFPPFPDQTTRVPMTHRRIFFCVKP